MLILVAKYLSILYNALDANATREKGGIPLRTMKRFFQNLKLRNKIFAILWLSLIPLSLTAMIGLTGITHSYREILYHNIASQLSRSAETISDQIQSIEMMSYMLAAHERVQQDMPLLEPGGDFTERSVALRDLFSLLMEYHTRFDGNHISYVSLFSGETSTSGNMPVALQTSHRVHDDVREQARRAGGSPVWVSSYSGKYGLFLSREILPAKGAGSDALGEEVVCIDIAGMVRDAVRFGGEYESTDYLLLDSEEVIFHSGGLSDLQASRVTQLLQQDYDELALDGRHYFAVRGAIPRSEWEYVCLVGFDAIHQQFRAVQYSYGLVVLLCIIMIVLFSSAAVGSLDNEIQALVSKMAAVGKNEWPDPDGAENYAERNDEIGQLHRRFDLMTEQLQYLIRTNYINELLKKEAQLSALENQINPHFLYNTLESINWRARAVGANDISTMAQSLGALLRVTLSESSEPFTLRRELELVRSYIAILAFRYEDRLTFSAEIPDELLELPFPKLTLQPLVENAISYGLEENTEGCEIRIDAQLDRNVAHIRVSNSGSSFEDDLLEKLRSRSAASHGHGIALLNIDRRLRLTYGEEYGLTLYNEDERAVARIDVPVGEERSC